MCLEPWEPRIADCCTYVRLTLLYGLGHTGHHALQGDKRGHGVSRRRRGARQSCRSFVALLVVVVVAAAVAAAAVFVVGGGKPLFRFDAGAGAFIFLS